MNLILSVLIGLSLVMITSCKQPSPEEIQKNRQKGQVSSGVKPSTPPQSPPSITLPPQPPPPITLPPQTPSEEEPPLGDLQPTNESLEAPGPPTWSLSPEPPPSDPYNQTWINSKFKSTKAQDNYNLLYSGVNKIILPPIDGSSEKVFEGFLAYGEDAFAAMAVPGQPQASFAAGAKYGLGKVFVFGARKWITEFGKFSPTNFGTATVDERNQITFLKNVFTWLLGSQYQLGQSYNFLTNINGLSFHPDFKLTGPSTPTFNFPNPIDVSAYPLVIVGHDYLNDNDVSYLLNYIKNGGNVLIGVRPWYGKYDEYINKILRPAGIMYYKTYKQLSNFNKPTLEDLKNSQFNLHSFYTLGQLEKNLGSVSEIDQRKIETALFPNDDAAFSCKVARNLQNVEITFPIKKK